MAERESTDTESFEFDFFEDSPTRETTREPAAPRLRRRRLPTRPPPSGTPLLRLAALIAAAIALVVLIVVWVSSCQEDRKTGQYRDYMEQVQSIGAESASIGRELNNVIFSSGMKLDDIQAQLDGLRDRQSQTVRQAEALDAPGPLREQHERLVDALELRVSGLNGLARAFSQVAGLPASGQADEGQNQAGGAGAGAAGETGRLLADQATRLVASDVLYKDFFEDPAKAVMNERGVADVAVPPSRFVTNSEFASPSSWQLVYERLTKPPAASGLHGNRVASVRALPSGEELSRDDENTVKVSDRLAFEVAVENSGDNQETQVHVTLLIQQSPQPIRRETEIDAINPGDVKTVVFRDLGTVAFGPEVILRVTVEPVKGEENTNNNVAEYPMIFTL
ncbi:MAG: hypothetical protein ICV71_04320 [Thermoleophilia bacterium]|nr:hypothetical protein [Thermoleophilia bacterium]MDQ3859560.1 hypothetical protein [Actinomycetota bacterium]